MDGLVYTPEFKSKVVIEVLREKQPLLKIAKKYDIQPFLIRRWTLQFIDIVKETLNSKDSEIEYIKRIY